MSEPKRMTDDELAKRFRYADAVNGGASSALREEIDRARASEAAKDKTIAALVDARDRVRSLLGHQDEQRNLYNPPGHAHQTPGRWDGTGAECALCIAWAELWRRLEALP